MPVAACAVLVLAGGALAACGQKGALILPGEAPTAATTMPLPPVRDPVPVGAMPVAPASAPLRR